MGQETKQHAGTAEREEGKGLGRRWHMKMGGGKKTKR